MATYRRLTAMTLERLALGPARPAELVSLFNLEPPDATKLLNRLWRKGIVHRTRLIFTGRRGGNVAVIYQLNRSIP